MPQSRLSPFTVVSGSNLRRSLVFLDTQKHFKIRHSLLIFMVLTRVDFAHYRIRKRTVLL